MKQPLMNNTLVRVSVLILAAFCVAAFFMPVIDLKRYMDAARIGIYAVLFFIVSRRAWTIYWSGPTTGGEIAAVALSMLAGAVLFHSIWTPFKRDLGHNFPDWFINGHVGSFIVLLYCFAGAGFLMPIGNAIGVTPPRNWWFLVAAGVIFGFVTGFMIALGVPPVTD